MAEKIAQCAKLQCDLLSLGLLLAALPPAAIGLHDPAPLDEVCGYPAEVITFDAGLDAQGTIVKPGTLLQITSLGVDGLEGPNSLDMSSKRCQDGNCPIYFTGINLDSILYAHGAAASLDMRNSDVMCFWGVGAECSTVPGEIQFDELVCKSPLPLPSSPGVAPFGLFVLGPDRTPPGKLYLADGLELNFFDPTLPPTLMNINPSFADVSVVANLEFPEEAPTLVVSGHNLGPGALVPQPVSCLWDGPRCRETVRPAAPPAAARASPRSAHPARRPSLSLPQGVRTTAACRAAAAPSHTPQPLTQPHLQRPPQDGRILSVDEVVALAAESIALGFSAAWSTQCEPSQPGQYIAEEQTLGDDLGHVRCPPPNIPRRRGTMAYLRVSIGGDEDELYSAAPGVALVYFDMNSKMLLLGHETEVAPLSEVYGDIRGGALLHLQGDNFAPLGPDLQCIFETPMRRDFHQGTGIAEYNGTINASSMPATYLSPQRILCEAPPYQRVGPTTLYVNSSFNTSLFERPEWGVVAQVQPRRRPSPHAPRSLRSPPLTRRPSLSLPQPGRGVRTAAACAARRAPPPAEITHLRPHLRPPVAQRVEFTYYDKSRPPTLELLSPPHVPTTGRALRLEGGGGRWEKYAGATVLGGVLLVGSNFAPTDFLWCRFGVPSEHATRRGPWRYSRAVYLNATQVRCEVPAGYAGDFSVSASHDDRMYSDDYKEWQIRPCTMPEIVRLATPKLNMKLYASVEEFEALGIEVLELELTRKSMRCGGSLHEMARRLYHWKFEHLHYPPDHHVLRRDEPRRRRPRPAAAGADVVQAPNGTAVPSAVDDVPNRPGEPNAGLPRKPDGQPVPGSGVLRHQEPQGRVRAQPRVAGGAQDLGARAQLRAVWARGARRDARPAAVHVRFRADRDRSDGGAGGELHRAGRPPGQRGPRHLRLVDRAAVPDAVAPAGTTIHVHVSITGYGNFSDDFVEVTYYNDVTLGNDRNTQTMVSAVAPLYGPVSAPSVVLARGTNFAPPPTQGADARPHLRGIPQSIGAGAGVDVPAIGTWATHVPAAVPGELGCVIVPMLAPAGTEVAGESTAAGLGNPELARHIVPATFVDYTRVLCNEAPGCTRVARSSATRGSASR